MAFVETALSGKDAWDAFCTMQTVQAKKGAPVSTLFTSGDGVGIVVGTGMNTEVGRIAHLVASADGPRMPLQRRIQIQSNDVSKLRVEVGIGTELEGRHAMRSEAVLVPDPVDGG